MLWILTYMSLVAKNLGWHSRSRASKEPTTPFHRKRTDPKQAEDSVKEAGHRAGVLTENRWAQRGSDEPEALASGCGKLYRPRSRLYRDEILQANMRLKALAQIYTIHKFTLLQNHFFIFLKFAKSLSKIFGIKKKLRIFNFAIYSIYCKI